MKNTGINKRLRDKARAALRRHEAKQAHEDAVRQSHGLLFAGVGTFAATIALGIQIWQTFETRDLNWRAVQGLAFERMEALRGTGIEFTSDWSYETIRASGHELIDLSWRGLTMKSVSVGKCSEDGFGDNAPASLDHAGTRLIESKLNCVKFAPGTALNGSKFLAVEIQNSDFYEADLSGSSFVGSTFRNTILQGARFDKATSLDGVVFENSSLEGAVFGKRIIASNGIYHDGRGNQIESAHRTTFVGSTLAGADLRRTHVLNAGRTYQFRDACFDTTSQIFVSDNDGAWPLGADERTKCICKQVDDHNERVKAGNRPFLYGSYIGDLVTDVSDCPR